MAYFSFTKKILAGETIQVFNNGEMMRDFTNIDDIIEGIERLINYQRRIRNLIVKIHRQVQATHLIESLILVTINRLN